MGRVVAIRGGAMAAAAVAVVLALGALALGGGRWMALPAVLPFLAWGLAGLALAGLAWLTFRQLHRDTATTRIATAIEHERRLRSGSLRGALEVGDTGVLGRRGARAIAARLTAGHSARGSLVPPLRRGATRRARPRCAAGGRGARPRRIRRRGDCRGNPRRRCHHGARWVERRGPPGA